MIKMNLKGIFSALVLVTAFMTQGCNRIENVEVVYNETTPVSETTLTEIVTTAETTEAYNPLVEIDFTFLGDCTLATQLGDSSQGTFNWYSDNYSADYFFEKTYPYICDDDFTIANCECVFTDNQLPTREKGYTPAFWFRSKSANAQIFSVSDIEAVSIANNHTYDYGQQGMDDTISALETAGIEWGNTEKDIILEKDGVKIGVVCGTMWYEWQGILDRLENIKSSTDIQIVFFHGGEEAVHQQESWKVQACHEIADAGADLIIGGHPHVLQPLENYNGVHIVYSIGNFCFGGNRYPENRTIVYKEHMTFNKDTKEIVSSQETIIPFYVYTGSINNFQPAPIEDSTISQQVIDFMYGNSYSPI